MHGLTNSKKKPIDRIMRNKNKYYLFLISIKMWSYGVIVFIVIERTSRLGIVPAVPGVSP